MTGVQYEMGSLLRDQSYCSLAAHLHGTVTTFGQAKPIKRKLPSQGLVGNFTALSQVNILMWSV